MLVLPYQTRFTPGSLPAVTFVLILLNAIAFFVLQRGDDAIYQQAFRQYAASDLPQIELPRYEQWLIDRADRRARERLATLRSLVAKQGPVAGLSLMQADAEFMDALRARRVITANDPQFGLWSLQRREFDALLERAAAERFALKPYWHEPWRLVTYQFLHGDFGHLLGNLIVLLLAGPFAEAALGRLRFLFGYLAGGAAAGALHLALSPGALVGASGSISAAMAMVAVLYGTRRVPVFYWVVFYFDTARVPALALLPVWIGNELYQWAADPDSHIAYTAHIGGFVAGAAIAWLLKPKDAQRIDSVLEAEFGDERRRRQQSELLRQAHDAAARLDTRRATRLYRELCELHPDRVDYMTACFNMALLAADAEELKDAALRVLWSRVKSHPEEFRKAFLSMTQPKVLQVLPVDEQLRLARRLVKHREDAAALRVLDGLLGDDNLRTLYARQIADCLLGLFTTYNRFGLKGPADNVKARLSRYFPSPDRIGGLPPNREMPLSIRGASTRPNTLNIDLSR
ncbi:MAG TPA: rhomboid family intramembrane serine protease [Burkholderiaceae bacterium]|nr:rhomboid family intramembrane serine protease [Burkholderiaceae bacterium]